MCIDVLCKLKEVGYTINYVACVDESEVGEWIGPKDGAEVVDFNLSAFQ